MTAYAELAARALLGVDRAAVDVDGWPVGPRAAVSGRDLGPRELALAGASLLLTRTRAGSVAPAATDDVTPAPDDERPCCPPAAAQRLRGLLREDRPDIDLIDEWLTSAERADVRCPYDTIPRLHQVTEASPHLRAVARAAGGPRWTWWRAAADDATTATVHRDPHEAVRVGTRRERADALRELRTLDGDSGRETLQQLWPTEAPDDRAALLAALDVGLSLADEPLLDLALRDRRKAVRDTARLLLMRLPHSAYADRMGQRLRACVTRESTLRGPRLTITVPTSCDAAMVADGIVATAPKGTGPGAWWLRQIVAATPLAAWDSVMGGNGTAAVGTRIEGTWRALLVDAWHDAAVSQRDAAWARALVGAGDLSTELIGLLPASERVDLAAALPARAPAGSRGAMLDGISGPLPDDVARRLFAWLLTPGDGVYETVSLLGRAAEPSLADEWRRRIPATPAHGTPHPTAVVVDRLTLRSTIRQEFA